MNTPYTPLTTPQTLWEQVGGSGSQAAPKEKVGN